MMEALRRMISNEDRTGLMSTGTDSRHLLRYLLAASVLV